MMVLGRKYQPAPPKKSVDLGWMFGLSCLSGSLQKNKLERRSKRLVLGGSDLPASENFVKLLVRSLEPWV